MVKVLFVPGGYGTYVGSCVYTYTSLADNNALILLDENGSSHHSRDMLKSNDKIEIGHDLQINDDDVFIVINGEETNSLDFINNQYTKNYSFIFENFANVWFNMDEIMHKLKHYWGYNSFNCAPKWVIRELLSFYMKKIIQNYPVLTYNKMPTILLNTNELFDNNCLILSIINKLEQYNIHQVIADEIIVDRHNQFVNAQKFHNSQNKCNKWVNDIINETYSISSCNTIFDEAYVQYCLRQKGYEIMCDGLDKFPVTSDKMKQILFNTTN